MARQQPTCGCKGARAEEQPASLPPSCCAKLPRGVGPGASTETMEAPEETEQTKIASFLLVPLDLAGCTGDPGASGAHRFRANSEQLAQPLGWGQPRVTTSPPAASGASWTETSHPSRAKLSCTSRPLHRLFPWLTDPSGPCPSSCN